MHQDPLLVSFIATWFACWISCSHLTGVNAADLWLHLSNMNVIWHMQLSNRSIDISIDNGEISKRSSWQSHPWLNWHFFTLRWSHNRYDGFSNHWRLFTQPFVQAQIKESIKPPRHWPLWGKFTGDRWIPRTKSQWRGKCFHLMTSSWESYVTPVWPGTCFTSDI